MRVPLVALAVLGLLPLRGASADSLGVDPTDPRFVGRGDLVLKLRTSVHDYFRFINSGFAAETCSLARVRLSRAPTFVSEMPSTSPISR